MGFPACFGDNSISSVPGKSHPELIKKISKIENTDQLSEWLTYYYLHPRPDLTLSSLEIESQSKLLGQSGSSPAITAALARIFADNQSLAIGLSESVLQRSEDQQFEVALALWAGLKEKSIGPLNQMATNGSQSLKKFVSELNSDKKYPNLLKDSITGPGFLDSLWATYFVTGDTKYVSRIVSSLSNAKSNDLNQKMIGAAAEWSLRSNIQQHPELRKFCEGEMAHSSSEIKKKLEEILKSSKKNH